MKPVIEGCGFWALTRPRLARACPQQPHPGSSQSRCTNWACPAWSLRRWCSQTPAAGAAVFRPPALRSARRGRRCILRVSHQPRRDADSPRPEKAFRSSVRAPVNAHAAWEGQFCRHFILKRFYQAQREGRRGGEGLSPTGALAERQDRAFPGRVSTRSLALCSRGTPFASLPVSLLQAGFHRPPGGSLDRWKPSPPLAFPPPGAPAPPTVSEGIPLSTQIRMLSSAPACPGGPHTTFWATVCCGNLTVQVKYHWRGKQNQIVSCPLRSSGNVLWICYSFAWSNKW